MRIVEGIAIIAGAIVLGVLSDGISDALWLSYGIGLQASTIIASAVAIGTIGLGLVESGIAQALGNGPATPFSIRQPAAARQVIYGQTRVAGTIIYCSTSESGSALNQVVCWAGHQIQSIDHIYLDGRDVIPVSGQCDSNGYSDDSGQGYNLQSDVYCYHFLGSPSGYWFETLYDTDPSWGSNCTLNGIAASYIQCIWNATVFPSEPGIKASVHGKNNIWDPRLGSYGASGAMVYTNNAALCIADVLLSTDFGLGCTVAEIDVDQLIDAANVCDQGITLASGAVESQYTINGSFDMTATPGEIIQSMLNACAGRLTYVGGVFGIYPGAWNAGTGGSVALDFDQNALIGPVKWQSRRKYRDLFNAVKGTYISPTYPYSVHGYDQEYRDSSVFGGEWQPTDFPEYAQDALHGYVSDANLAEDGGRKMYGNLSLRFCTSVCQAQRVAKIALLRNRFQGTGTIQMNLQALACKPQDIITLTFPQFGWVGKYLEVTAMRFNFVDEPDSGNNKGGKSANVKRLIVELDVVETDESIYVWSAAEQLSPTNALSPAISHTWLVNPPTSLILESGADSAVVGADGVIIPRINVTWVEPADPFVTSGGSVEIQLQKSGGAWQNLGYFSPTLQQTYITGVICGQTYYVQMRSVRPNGATSGWAPSTAHTVSETLSTFSYEDITGLGALATLNYVDFATTEVTNKTANNMNYSTGLSVESLRPAESLADVTAGKSLDILSDGATYSRTLVSQSSLGVILGKSYGAGLNLIPNGDFSACFINPSFPDDWSYGSVGAAYTIERETIYGPEGGVDVLIRLNQGQTFGPGSAFGQIVSSNFPVTGGSNLYVTGQCRLDFNNSSPDLIINAVVYIRFFDANIAPIFSADTTINTDLLAGYWRAFDTNNNVAVPGNAAFACFILASTADATVTAVTGTYLYADIRFAQLSILKQAGNSGLLNSQGAIGITQPITINFSVTNSSCTFSWSAQSVLRGDGTTLTTNAGSLTMSGLAPSTAYYTYWYISATTGNVGCVNNPPSTTADGVDAVEAGSDGRIPTAPISFTTLASGSSGSSGGSGGGGNDICPEGNELVSVQVTTTAYAASSTSLTPPVATSVTTTQSITASAVVAGMLIKGWSFVSKSYVYRPVTQVASVNQHAWRNVSGHLVSPCEPIWNGTNWQPAYRASATQVKQLGRKMLISVQADAQDEANYYLLADTGKTELLIHNTYISRC